MVRVEKGCGAVSDGREILGIFTARKSKETEGKKRVPFFIRDFLRDRAPHIRTFYIANRCKVYLVIAAIEVFAYIGNILSFLREKHCERVAIALAT